MLERANTTTHGSNQSTHLEQELFLLKPFVKHLTWSGHNRSLWTDFLSLLVVVLFRIYLLNYCLRTSFAWCLERISNRTVQWSYIYCNWMQVYYIKKSILFAIFSFDSAEFGDNDGFTFSPFDTVFVFSQHSTKFKTVSPHQNFLNLFLNILQQS